MGESSCYAQHIELIDIRENLRDIVKAIKSVINVDVTIIDRSLNRVVATCDYVQEEDCLVDKNSVASYALDFGRAFIIENPREHFACQQCAEKDQCQEEAQVCCPITMDGQTIGVIGLVAMNVDQKNEILKNKDNLLNFLMRMADLIASKINEAKHAAKLELRSAELQVLLDAIDRAVIAVDTAGQVLNRNAFAENLFGLKKVDRFDHALSDFSLQQFLQSKQSRGEAKLLSGERLIFTVQRIYLQGEIHEFVFSFTPVQQLMQTVSSMVTAVKPLSFDDIVGEDPAFKEVKHFADKVAKSSSNVLILGESGTGKELFARAIHGQSSRKDAAFVPINCAAIPEGLLESELFGYEDGAFTGAKTGGKIGKFELANNGTIFLDEIGDMPLHLQAKILRVLQDGVVERVGGYGGIPVNVRVIAATHQNIQQMVQDKTFREDLYYRLSVLPIQVPPLRERMEDIPLLVDLFMRQVADQLEKTIVRVHEDVLSVFKTYMWPGNVRELQNIIEYAVVMNVDGIIGYTDLPKTFKKPVRTVVTEHLNLKQLEKKAIEKALNIHGRSVGSIQKACDDLGISRATLYRKMKQYKL